MVFKALKSFIKGFRLSLYYTKYEKMNASYDFKKLLVQPASPSQLFMEDFVNFCLQDPRVKRLVHTYNVDKNELFEIQSLLSITILNQRTKGHIPSLATLAYVEPLIYSVVKYRERGSSSEWTNKLFKYWNDQISQGFLLREASNSEKWIEDSLI